MRWMVPNEQPQIATADDGVIGQSGITYDQNGNATGQMGSLALQSWMGNAYQMGSVESVLPRMIFFAYTWWASRQANDSGNLTAAKVAQVRLRVFTLNGAQKIDLAGIVKDAQSTWAKQSNGMIELLWDHSIQSVDPCAKPNCGTGDPWDLIDLLPYSPQDLGNLWVQTNYLLQKFPNRQGINVVHNATIPSGYAVTLPVPLPTYQQFVNKTTAESNIILLPNNTGNFLGHEVGHVLGLQHVSNPFNLMCGAPDGANPFVVWLDNNWCYSATAFSLNTDQLTTAKPKASALAEK